MEQQNNRKVSLKKASYLMVVLALICFLLGGLFVYASSPASFGTFTSGSYPGGWSYTVFVDDGVYYAKTAYGNIAFSSSTAADVINYAWALGDTFLSAGVYALGENPLSQIDDSHRLWGAGVDETTLTYSGTNATILIGIDGAVTYNMDVGYFSIVNSNVGGDGIILNGLRESKIHDISIVGPAGCTSIGIYITGSTGVWTATSSIEHVRINNIKTGIQLHATADYDCNGWLIDDAYLMNGVGATGGYGLVIDSYCNYNTLNHVLTEGFDVGYLIAGTEGKMTALQSELDTIGLYLTSDSAGNLVNGFFPVSFVTTDIKDEGRFNQMNNVYWHERFVGKLPNMQYDPTTTTWGTEEAGVYWFNTLQGKMKYWNGTAVITP